MEAGRLAARTENRDHLEQQSATAARCSTTFYELDPLKDPRWDDFVQRHPNSSVFHTRAWLQALSLTYGYEPFVLCTSAPGESLSNALVLCRVRSWFTGSRLVSLPFSDHCDPLLESTERLDDLLAELNCRFDATSRHYIEVRPLHYHPATTTGFTTSYTGALHTIDLRHSLESLFHRSHKDCIQRKIRRAERESLRCEAGESDELLIKFYRLLVMTRRRHYLVPQPLLWFRHLSRSFGKDLQIRLAFLKDVPVAGILTLKHGSTLTYKYGGSDPRFHNLGCMPLLFWKTIQEAKAEGLTQFELGRSDLTNSGLIAFKEHLGARLEVLRYWRYPLRDEHPRRETAKRFLRRLAVVAPDWLLVSGGKLIYPHIG